MCKIMAGVQSEKVVARQVCSLSVMYTTDKKNMYHVIVYLQIHRETQNYLFYFFEEL